MTNHTTYKTNNYLNGRFSFSFTGFISLGVVAFLLLQSLFTTLFSIKTLQIQFYNLQGKGIQNQNQLHTQQDAVLFVEDSTRFDNVLFPRDFKTYI
ncbi:hypothetical protein ACE193_19610 [Bernardetia sp. OM2101]|uniref:hypothetical protein n=1 Tax=Bernardetia sp. OM2101 TaxID=3344876 RepID=UPI0035CEF023